MTWRIFRTGFVSLTLFLSTIATASQALVFGTADFPSNGFRFGSTAGSRYRQVYAASEFSGPVSIVGISFFAQNDPTNLSRTYTGGLYTVSLSTTPLGVNTINQSSNFDANLGADNQFFASVTLSGTIDEILNFSGTAFSYDPGQGDLLIDIQVSGATVAGGALFLEDRTTTVMSKAHDFGSGFDGRGLVTEFAFGESVTISEPAFMMLVALGLASIALRRRTYPRCFRKDAASCSNDVGE